MPTPRTDAEACLAARSTGARVSGVTAWTRQISRNASINSPSARRSSGAVTVSSKSPISTSRENENSRGFLRRAPMAPPPVLPQDGFEPGEERRQAQPALGRQVLEIHAAVRHFPVLRDLDLLELGADRPQP